MATRYWIGDGGAWNDTAHWSDTSGGTGGFSVPTTTDAVLFDANSFTTGSQTVTMGSANRAGASINWTGVTNTPTWNMGGFVFTSSGDVTLIVGMSVINAGNLVVNGTSTVNVSGHTFANVSFTGTGDVYNLASSITTATFTHTRSELNTNDYAITCSVDFLSNGSNTRSLYLGSSTITVSGHFTLTSTGLTFDSGTSLIVMTSASAKNFNGAGKTFYNLELDGAGAKTINGGNTFNDIYIHPNRTVIFENSSTTTTGDLSGDGTIGNLIVLRSVTAATSFTLNISGSGIEVDYYSIKDCTGNNKIYAKRSTDVSGNSNIYFYSMPTGAKYWVGNGGAWEDPTHWANVSGGIGDQPKPDYTDTVIFDENSFSVGGQIVSGSTDPTGHAEVLQIDFTYVTNNPTLDHYIHVRGTSATFSAGMTVDPDSRVLFVPVASTTAYLTSAGHYFDYVSVSGDDFDFPVTLELLDALDVRALQVFWAANFKSNGYDMTSSGASSIIDFQGADTVTLGASEIHTEILQATAYSVAHPMSFSHSGDLYVTTDMQMNHPGETTTFQTGNLFLGTLGLGCSVEGKWKCSQLTLYKGVTYTGNTYAHDIYTEGSSIEFVTLVQDADVGNPIIWTVGDIAYNFNFICTTGTVSVDWWVINDNDATGGAAFYAGDNSTDGTGNSGWIFESIYSWITPIWDRTAIYLKYYNFGDANRVANNSIYLKQYAATKAITIVLSAYTQQTITDVGTYALINLLEHNINLIVAEIVEPGGWAVLSEDWDATNDVFGINDANALEFDQLLLKLALEAL